jgi:hypothetical protein
MLALATGARAGDVQTLKLTDKTPTLSLVGDKSDPADTVDVAGHGGFHGGGFHGGGFHSFHGGFHSFHGGFHNFHGGFHSFHSFHSFHHGFHGFYGGFGYYRPYYYSSYYYASPYYYGSPYYYSSPYYAPSYYSDPCYSYYGVAGDYAPTVGLTIDQAPAERTIIGSDPAGTPAPPPLPRADDTYPYDGGPRQPVPMPKADPAPIATPPATAPLEGRAVSLPPKAPKLTYPAYGESIGGSDDRGLVVKKAPK